MEKLKINKNELIRQLILSLEEELLALKKAAQATYQAATHEESKPENEYDTFALEASYLAGAQAKRAGQIDEIITMFRHLEVRTFSPEDEIASTALVALRSGGGKETWVWLMPSGGGFQLSSAGVQIQIITPHSLLGEALVGLRLGDHAEIEINQQMKEFEIRQVL